MSNEVTFLHFSDIHFNKHCDARFDPDCDLRAAMLQDVKDFAGERQLHPYGIIICGDIAYSGKKNEYEMADEFIGELTGNLNIDEQHVFCVPGNHDVDQDVAKNSISVYAVQKLLEEAEEADFPYYLSAIQMEEDRENRKILYRGIKNYNEFAGRYMSNVSPDEKQWIHDVEVKFDDGYKLCLFGINSTIISNADDHKGRDESNPRKMRIGSHQIPGVEKKKIYITVCHHPVDMWADDIGTKLDERAMVQLYGHKHKHTMDANEKRVRIETGALQPDRHGGGWQSRYNFLSLTIEEGALKLRLYPRILNNERGWFEADFEECDDGVDYKEVVLSLGKPARKARRDEESGPVIRETPSNRRKLVYKLWGLTKEERGQLVGKYDELSGFSLDDLNQSVGEFLAVAAKNNLVDELVRKIESHEY